jgi:hypothetical protein
MRARGPLTIYLQWQEAIGKNISFGSNGITMVVMGLIISDEVPDREHMRIVRQCFPRWNKLRGLSGQISNDQQTKKGGAAGCCSPLFHLTFPPERAPQQGFPPHQAPVPSIARIR